METTALLAGGFVPTTYPDQEGEFLVKTVTVERLPYAGKHIVDDNIIYGDMKAITELRPDGLVQLYIPDADYIEGPYPLASEDAQNLLRDALSAS